MAKKIVFEGVSAQTVEELKRAFETANKRIQRARKLSATDETAGDYFNAYGRIRENRRFKLSDYTHDEKGIKQAFAEVTQFLIEPTTREAFLNYKRIGEGAEATAEEVRDWDRSNQEAVKNKVNYSEFNNFVYHTLDYENIRGENISDLVEMFGAYKKGKKTDLEAIKDELEKRKTQRSTRAKNQRARRKKAAK